MLILILMDREMFGMDTWNLEQNLDGIIHPGIIIIHLDIRIIHPCIIISHLGITIIHPAILIICQGTIIIHPGIIISYPGIKIIHPGIIIIHPGIRIHPGIIIYPGIRIHPGIRIIQPGIRIIHPGIELFIQVAGFVSRYPYSSRCQDYIQGLFFIKIFKIHFNYSDMFRWFDEQLGNPEHPLLSVTTGDILPVDLNTILYKYTLYNPLQVYLIQPFTRILNTILYKYT